MAQSWRKWLEEFRANATMKVKLVGLQWLREGRKDSPKWVVMDGMHGEYLANTVHDFFTILGLQVFTKNREVEAWKQPVIREEGGVVVLVTDGKGDYLIAAREEPGNGHNKQCVLLGPPFQASLANAEQRHGGNPPPRVELFNDPRVDWTEQPEDGGRFIGLGDTAKTTRIGILQVEDLGDKGPNGIELRPNERIFTLPELCEAIREGECNPHLVQAWAHSVAMV